MVPGSPCPRSLFLEAGEADLCKDRKPLMIGMAGIAPLTLCISTVIAV